jgi:hypothetical protein
MKNKTKPYITLRDREWKGKDWFTSFKGHQNIRKLTNEEAEPLLEECTIQEVVLPEYKKDIVGDKNGRMFCKICGSNKGFYIKKRPFGKKINVFTCANCGIREIKQI